MEEADKYFSLWVRLNANWYCERCEGYFGNRKTALHCSHFKGRDAYLTRYNPDNANALCFSCHAYFTKHPKEHREWQVAKKGEDKVQEIERLSWTIGKHDYDEERRYWKHKLKEDFNFIGGNYG